MKLALVGAIILSVLMALFAVQNAQQVQVTFLGWYFDGPLVIVLLLTFGIGVLAAFLSMFPGVVKRSREIAKLKSALAACPSLTSSGFSESSARDSGPQHETPHNNSPTGL